MLFLPLEEDSWLFLLCLYYGLLVLLLELLVPLVFHRRVRVEIPRLALHGPAVPLSTREFMQRRRALQQQLAALQRALAETPRRSPQKRKQLLDASAAKDRPEASPSPSLETSPTSSVKVSRLQSSRETSESKRQIERRLERKDHREEQRDQVPSQRPAATNNSSGTRPAQSGGFSFNEVAREEKEEETQVSWNEPVVWEQAVSMRAARRRESPTFSGPRPVRLVSEDVGAVTYNGPSEAASRLEALIRARRRRARTPPVYVPPPSQPLPTATVPSPSSPPLEEVPVTEIEESLENSASHAPKPVPHSIPSPIGQQDERNANEEETKDSEQYESLTDFQAFCSSFATGGSAAAQKAITKRKHHEAFGSEDEQANDGAGVAQQSVEKRKQPRVFEQHEGQVDDDVTAAATHSAEKRRHHEAIGSDDENASDDAVEAEQVLEKRTHAEAFGAENKPDRPQEKTPRIARRISFSDEVAALSAASPKEVPGGRSSAKRKHQQAFGMIDEEDEDADWRESLAFRPHRSG